MTRAWILIVWAAALSAYLSTTAAEAGESDDGLEKEWKVDELRGPAFEQEIDAKEGTWMSLDVHPDGTEIVFDFLGDLYVMPLDVEDGEEREVKPLTRGAAWDMQPKFSPDGEWIAFTSDRTGKDGKGGDNIWIIRRDGSETRQITAEDFRLLNGPSWAPDGQYVVARKHFTSRRSLGAGEMWLYHIDGVEAGASGGVQLTERPNDQKDVNEPVFSPDGRYLYYSRDVTPGERFEYDKDSTKGIYAIQRLDLEKRETDTYISGPGGACRPTPSPDGKTIAFVRRVDGNTGLHLFDVQSGAVRLLYDDLERDNQETWAIHGVYPAFDWTPNGESIVVWAKGKIWRIDVGDGSAENLAFRIRDKRTVTKAQRVPIEAAPDEFDLRMARWAEVSPGGDRVVFQALGHIYVKDLPEGTPRRLTSQTNHFEFYPSWSRDGRNIVYTTWHDQEFGSVRVASVGADRENWKVTNEPGHYVEPVFSPEGDIIVYRKVEGGGLRSPVWSQNRGIYRAPVHGGEAALIIENGFRPQFGARSDTLYLLKRERGDDADNLTFFSVNLDGHEPREVYQMDWGTDCRVSPDGRWVAFVERFNVFVAPFVRGSKVIQVGPKAKNLPVIQANEEAGSGVHFSGDGQRLHWTLGPDLYTQGIEALRNSIGDGDNNKEAESKVERISIGFKHPQTKPAGAIALVGGRIVTMSDDGVIEEGVVVIEQNRIHKVGRAGEVEIPDGAERIELDGRVVLPGFIDVHAHGPQGQDGIIPRQNWVDLARLAFGVTTIHDPSNDTETIFAASELAKAGGIVAPRTFSTGTILYGAAGSYKAEVGSLEDALFHLKRMQAVGALTVKSYNQPRRDQRQQIMEAARQLGMMVMPEGGATFMHNLTMVVDGHTGIEHTLPVQNAYDDVMDLWRGTGVGYTPTLSVAYGGLGGENYWYEIFDYWKHPRIRTFIPPEEIVPRARRRIKAPVEDYNHMKVAGIAKQLVDLGELVQAGGHGQLNGVDTHWEMWSFVQGGMTPMEALRCGTINGAKYIGLDNDLGSIEEGKLADLVIMEAGADPTTDIRASERVETVILNGRVFDAATMNEAGQETRRPFYWEGKEGGGVIQALEPGVHCPGCGR